jgi:SAM-dependent methyltransferase
VTDLTHPRFPRASTYDADWLLSLDMGPNPLWLLEDLLADVDLRAGMRVLDLGSGKGATSVFLARELGVEVWAVDLWIDSETATRTFRAAGVDRAVHAVQADVRALAFEPDFFDAIVSIDAWEYFGTDDHLLPRLLRVLRPEGQLGVVTPAMRTEARALGFIPEHIREVVGWEALAWHTAEWWRQQWTLSGLLHVTAARLQPGGGEDWLRWARAVHDRGHAESKASVDMLTLDEGQLLTFAIVAGRKVGTG